MPSGFRGCGGELSGLSSGQRKPDRPLVEHRARGDRAGRGRRRFVAMDAGGKIDAPRTRSAFRQREQRQAGRLAELLHAKVGRPGSGLHPHDKFAWIEDRVFGWNDGIHGRNFRLEYADQSILFNSPTTHRGLNSQLCCGGQAKGGRSIITTDFSARRSRNPPAAGKPNLNSNPLHRRQRSKRRGRLPARRGIGLQPGGRHTTLRSLCCLL